ncbi:MAG TPA: serine hydrolase domain-containing protein [Longimicrobiales bacterium]|nr:serine hydrolase domain-containing protein [Longimicrobiales bacterium]
MLSRLLPLLVLLYTAPLEATPPWPEARPDSVGMSEAALEEVDRLIDEAIANGVTPGAALAIGRHGKLVRLRGYGYLDWEGETKATASTIYDISSLTKVAGTTIGIMRHVESGLIRLDDRVYRHLRWWPRKGRAGRVTIRHLLAHTSGLPAGVDLERRGRTRSQRIRSIAKLRFVSEPGREANYSDLGMIVLGAILEQKQGRRLDSYLRERVFQPLGLRETLFRPAEDASHLLGRTAPTEVNAYSGVAVHGVVHDPLAAALDGVAGHAGLFSSARDLAVISQKLLDTARSRRSAIVKPATLKLFTRRGRDDRGLGWDLASGDDSPAGQYLSASTFGHTGFTGTSIWIDPELDLFIVLLTNRLHPSASNVGHILLRRQVHDATALAITDRVLARRSETFQDR